MVETNWILHSVGIGIVGVRRQLRTMRRNKQRFLLLGLSLVCLGIVFGGMGALYALVLRTATGPIAVPYQVRVGVLFLWLFGVWFFAKRVILYRRRPDSEGFILTTVAPQTVALGLLIREFFLACLTAIFVIPFLVGPIAYAFQRPESLVLLSLTVVLFISGIIVTGYTVGFGYLIFSVNSYVGSHNRSNLGLQLVMFLIASYVMLQVLFPVPDPTKLIPMSRIPITWFIDIGLLGTPIAVSPVNAVAGVVGSAIGSLVGGILSVRLATAYWATDRGAARQESETSQFHHRGNDTLAAAIAPITIPHIINAPTRRVAQLVVLRLHRTPRKASFIIAIFLSIGVYAGMISARMDNLMAVILVLCSFCLPILVGAVFGLNPLGDEGAALPATLTSPVSGVQYIRGVMLPGLLYGLPLTIITTALAGLFSPYQLDRAIGFVIIGAVLTIATVVSAPAIGIRFPHFDALTIGQSREAVQPSLIAISIYLISISAFGGIGILVLLVSSSIQNVLMILSGGSVVLSSYGIRVGGLIGWTIITVGFSYLLYRDAVHRFDSYTI